MIEIIIDDDNSRLSLTYVRLMINILYSIFKDSPLKILPFMFQRWILRYFFTWYLGQLQVRFNISDTLTVSGVDQSAISIPNLTFITMFEYGCMLGRPWVYHYNVYIMLYARHALGLPLQCVYNVVCQARPGSTTTMCIYCCQARPGSTTTMCIYCCI